MQRRPMMMILYIHVRPSFQKLINDVSVVLGYCPIESRITILISTINRHSTTQQRKNLIIIIKTSCINEPFDKFWTDI